MGIVSQSYGYRWGFLSEVLTGPTRPPMMRDVGDECGLRDEDRTERAQACEERTGSRGLIRLRQAEPGRSLTGSVGQPETDGFCIEPVGVPTEGEPAGAVEEPPKRGADQERRAAGYGVRGRNNISGGLSDQADSVGC